MLAPRGQKCWALSAPHKSALRPRSWEGGIPPPTPTPTLRPSRSVASSKRQRALHRSAETRVFPQGLEKATHPLSAPQPTARSSPTIARGLRRNATQIVPYFVSSQGGAHAKHPSFTRHYRATPKNPVHDLFTAPSHNKTGFATALHPVCVALRSKQGGGSLPPCQLSLSKSV